MDPDLVVRARSGDRDAFEELARAKVRRLYLVAYRILRDADAAEDAVQGALIAMWRDLPGLREPDRFDAWSDRLVVRCCLKEGRRPRRLGVLHVRLGDDVPGSGDAFAEVATRDELDRAFSSLSAEHRAVLVLHHYLGLSQREIGELIGVPTGTVGSRIHHATRAMRASLEAGSRVAMPGGTGI